MATTAIGNDNPTFMDAYRRMDPNGSLANIVEVLQRDTPELQDATVMEGNLITGHRITSRTALPTATWRMANQGIPGSKSLAGQLDEHTAELAAKSQGGPAVP